MGVLLAIALGAGVGLELGKGLEIAEGEVDGEAEGVVLTWETGWQALRTNKAVESKMRLDMIRGSFCKADLDDAAAFAEVPKNLLNSKFIYVSICSMVFY